MKYLSLLILSIYFFLDIQSGIRRLIQMQEFNYYELKDLLLNQDKMFRYLIKVQEKIIRKKCPSALGKYCYTFHFEKKNWTEARAVCMEEGGDLAIPTQDYKKVWAMLSSKASEIYVDTEETWVGGREVSEQWVWVTGEEFSSTNTLWMNYQPNGHYGADCDCCVYVLSSGIGDSYCHVQKPFICQSSLELYDKIN